MKKTSIRKLLMKRETLCTLTAPDLAKVAGGAYSDRCTELCSRLETRCECQTVTRETCNTACMWSANPCQL